MENLILSFNTVMPMFLVMLVGYALRAFGVVNGATVSQMNKMLMRSLVPVLMFQNIYSSERGALASPKLLLFCVFGVLGMYALSFVIGMVTETEGARRGVVIQALYRGNMMAMAVPLAESLLGEGNQGPLAVCLAIVIPMFNVLAVITLELFNHGKPDLRSILKGIATNGLIWGCVAGIVFYGLDILLPLFVRKAVSNLAAASSPMILLVLGASFQFSTVGPNLRSIIICVTGRLILMPAILVSLGVAMGFRDVELICVLSVSACPVAAMSYTMAEQMGGDKDLAAAGIVFTSLFSCITLFLWVFLLKQLQLF